MLVIFPIPMEIPMNLKDPVHSLSQAHLSTLLMGAARLVQVFFASCIIVAIGL